MVRLEVVELVAYGRPETHGKPEVFLAWLRSRYLLRMKSTTLGYDREPFVKNIHTYIKKLNYLIQKVNPPLCPALIELCGREVLWQSLQIEAQGLQCRLPSILIHIFAALEEETASYHFIFGFF